MEYKVLGRTGLRVSEVGFGGIPILRLPTEEAVQILRHAFDKGITFFDTANAYRDSEDKIGQAFHGMREQVVIATKTMKRDAAGAQEHLDNSLRMLQTDYIDIYQFHQVAQEADWEAISGPSGAMGAVLKAREAGKVRNIGATSHSLPMAIRLVRSGLFNTIQFPFNFIEDAAKDVLFQAAGEMNVGVIAMKPFAGGVIASAALAFKFLRQHPAAVPIPGFDSVDAVDEVISLYQQPNRVTDSDRLAMDQVRAEVGGQFCRRCEYCQPCPNGVMITPAMGYPIVAHRMSPAVAVRFSKDPMETVPLCSECGVCTTLCPYELPISEILKKNYELYKQQLDALSPKA
ncbi:MAG: aldo/keto reductase [Firmicutes bacterium]|nr:aldo/keto reductase [Bacillota bacterium]